MYFRAYMTIDGELINIDLHQVTAVRKRDSMTSVVHLMDGKAWMVTTPFEDVIAALVDATEVIS